MPLYKYTVKNEHGDSITGKVEASSRNQAAALLSSRGLIVINIHAFGEDALSSITGLFNKVKHDDVVNFTRQLSTMITAGLPLATALSILQEQGTPEVVRMVSGLLKEVEGGSSFSSALAKQSAIFGRVYVQLVKAGELGGVLDQVLNRLAETMEKQKDFRSKTQGAMIYPIIVILAMIAVGFIMMIFVVPKLMSMYKDFGADLPLPTKILIGTSDFFVKFWWLFIILGIGGGAAFAQWYKTPVGQKTIDAFLFRIPIFGTLRKKIILTEFSRTLSLLLGAGVSLLEAMDIVSNAMESISYREALGIATKEVEKGTSLSQAISRFEIFPPILYQMVAVGEETGKMDEVLLKISSYFEAESEQAVKNLTAAMEPMIMIVLGIGVGLLVVAIIMPIYSLTSKF